MPPIRNIITIGASAGGFEAFRRIIADLPEDFDASIFIVWHMAPDIRSVLPQVLNRANPAIITAHAYDGEIVMPRRVYVAPPDRHMLLEEGGVIRVTKGPKENRFRPAADPLFRSAAYAYGRRVIGVVLSGGLDDGTAGLWTIKHRGGTAVVQSPHDAEVRSMPENALREVAVDYAVPVSEMAGLLTRLSREEVPDEAMPTSAEEDERTRMEIAVAAEVHIPDAAIMNLGALTPFTCPECHGVLTQIVEGQRTRYRCHTGHAFSADTLLSSLTENIEDSLWNAIRGVEESAMLLNHIGDHYAEMNEPKLAAVYFQKAKEAEGRADVVRQAVFSHEQLSKDGVRDEAERGEEA